MTYTVAFNVGALLKGLNIQIKQALADALELTARPGQFIVKGIAEHTKDVLQFNVSNAIAGAAGR